MIPSSYVLAIDPANKQSAYCLMDGYEPILFDKVDNEEMLNVLTDILNKYNCVVAIEMVASYGLPVGKDVFETCVFIGRIIERIISIKDKDYYTYVYRKQVKLNICGRLQSVNDTTVRHALINRFAQHDFRSGKGTKKNKDYFYGFSADIWSSFAVGTTYLDLRPADCG